MIRRLAMATSFLLGAALPAAAQHPTAHPRGVYPHGPGHVPPDSATHAAMHAWLQGSWTGTLRSHDGVSSALDMRVTHDSLRNVMLMMKGDPQFHFGTAADFAMNGEKLQWTQNLSGRSCKATAVLSTFTPMTAGAITGELVCEDGDMTFSLHRKTG
jgi:hypothetical protein